LEATVKVGVRDISRRTGFSPATVSNALNHKRGVSKKTAEAIIKAAQELGYQRPNKLEKIVFIVARKSGRVLDESDFHPIVINGVEREARCHGLSTNYVTVDLLDPESGPLLHEMCQDPTNGIVLLGTEMEEGDYAPFYGSVAPLVIVDGWCVRDFIESIVISNESSAYRAVRYLIDKGHTRIGYLRGDLQIRNFPLRKRGYLLALREAGLEFDRRYEVTVGTTISTAYEASRKWVAANNDLPTAFFAENDVMACGMMRALLEAGYRVPQDVSFVGFDDLPLATAMLPALTTLHVPKHDIGEIAVRKLIEQVRDPHDYVCTTHISARFVERDSVAQV
jgi:LacI family transcriptional regulator/LacI family purine nucleotide synthesis repressor